MRGMKARQCTLNGRREWRTTMGDRRFFRRRVRRFPRESTAHFERGRIFARWWAPTDGDWTRVPAPLFAANRDFRNRRGIKNPDNCSLFSRWRDRSIFAQRPRAPRAASISSYRPLGDVIIARDEMSRNDCQLNPRYLSGILIESIDFFSTTCNSIVEIVYIFPGFVICRGM